MIRRALRHSQGWPPSSDPRSTGDTPAELLGDHLLLLIAYAKTPPVLSAALVFGTSPACAKPASVRLDCETTRRDTDRIESSASRSCSQSPARWRCSRPLSYSNPQF